MLVTANYLVGICPTYVYKGAVYARMAVKQQHLHSFHVIFSIRGHSY